jgi:hypothetical protein
MFSIRTLKAINKTQSNGTMYRPLTQAHINAKTESKKRYYARLAAQASKTIVIAFICISASFAGGMASNDNANAHYSQPKTITMGFDKCVTLFMSFYVAYPAYHYETLDGTVNFDYVVANPEEEAWQHCSFFFYGE